MIRTCRLQSDSLELPTRPPAQRWGITTRATTTKCVAIVETQGECQGELGHEQLEILILRGTIACCRGEAGDPVGAAEAFAELLTDRLRALGLNHPDISTHMPQPHLLGS
jgi:hypothetical protein